MDVFLFKEPLIQYEWMYGKYTWLVLGKVYLHFYKHSCFIFFFNIKTEPRTPVSETGISTQPALQKYTSGERSSSCRV